MCRRADSRDRIDRQARRSPDEVVVDGHDPRPPVRVVAVRGVAGLGSRRRGRRPGTPTPPRPPSAPPARFAARTRRRSPSTARGRRPPGGIGTRHGPNRPARGRDCREEGVHPGFDRPIEAPRPGRDGEEKRDQEGEPCGREATWPNHGDAREADRTRRPFIGLGPSPKRTDTTRESRRRWEQPGRGAEWNRPPPNV